VVTYEAREAEDSAHVSGDDGKPILGVRNDGGVPRTDADGDYGFPALDAAGRVGVTLLGGSSLPVELGRGERDPVPVSLADLDMLLESVAAMLSLLLPIAARPGATPSPHSAGQRVRPLTTLDGVQYAIGGHPDVRSIEYSVGTAAQTTFKLVDVVVGQRCVVTRASVMISKACTVNVGTRIGFGATPDSTTLAAVGSTQLVPTSGMMVLSHPKLAPGSGVVEGNGMAKLAQGGDGCDLFLTCDISTGGASNNAVRVLISYFLEPSA
jgi:hypothetical protein